MLNKEEKINRLKERFKLGIDRNKILFLKDSGINGSFEFSYRDILSIFDYEHTPHNLKNFEEYTSNFSEIKKQSLSISIRNQYSFSVQCYYEINNLTQNEVLNNLEFIKASINKFIFEISDINFKDEPMVDENFIKALNFDL
ncbi:hypothetical protein EI427_05645 [Flammeovirga pectinis]|uniref:Uncharacterized protein n=1 Tax=Flammeovirga pectinis TaxID=2494373 RepID=A0A3Q9FJT7_9BACT|nr:hypothetical protein [Flammeovirga pectinis]AZQ61735.1 hypothetical protein EI427_05645 [Flammeovirga pectinis]